MSSNEHETSPGVEVKNNNLSLNVKKTSVPTLPRRPLQRGLSEAQNSLVSTSNLVSLPALQTFGHSLLPSLAVSVSVGQLEQTEWDVPYKR